MIIIRSMVILLFILSLCNAENNNTTEYESSYIDDTHKMLSETIINWSEALDTMVSDWLEDNETNLTTFDETNTTTLDETNTTSEVTYVPSNKTTTVTHVPVHRETTPVTDVSMNTPTLEPNTSENTLEDRIKSADAFFQNNKYLDETENNYVRIRLESFFQSKESSDFDLTLRAQMPFRKSKKHLKIFVENINVDNARDILQDDDKENSPDIGVSYFAPDTYGINARYSLGLSGIEPFVKARYNMPIKTDKWLIDLVQQFQYSSDDKFEEETNIYFDKEVGKKSLLRIQLYRSSQEDVDGMNYALSLRYYESLKKHTGFGFGQTFVGNTEYQYTDDNGQTNTFAGINDYITSVSFRKNIWRKWFFYEVRPSVSFHKQYDYEANYRIRVFFDIYLGKFN